VKELNPPAVVRQVDDLATLAAAINRAHAEGERLTHRGLEHFHAAGEALLKAKAQCGHGKWLKWLKDNIQFSGRQARNYMQLAKLAVTANLGDEWRKILGNAPTEDATDDATPPPAGAEPEPESAEAPRPTPGPAQVDCADCLDWLRARPENSCDLVFGSGPYEDLRTYLENGVDLSIARTPEEWVRLMVEVVEAALRCCRGLVAFVVDGPTRNFRWSPSPIHLMAQLDRRGVVLRKPHVYERQGIPGGVPDMPRNDYEFILLATRGGRLAWSDPTAMGHAPKSPVGPRDGHRAPGEGYATQEDIRNVGHHRARQRAGYRYRDPKRVKASNVIHCAVGHGKMGDPLCHLNEAPMPLELAEFFVRTYCPPNGLVADPFAGSGTTGHAALKWGRRFAGCDLRQSQVELCRRRLANVRPLGAGVADSTTKQD
jgi:hypothetical protein